MKTEKLGTIYIWTNLINGKKYVGQTIGKFEKRLARHIYNAKNDNRHLYNAIRKYGLENFVIESKEIPIEKLDFAERYLIKICKSTNSKFGYNSDSGGNRGKIVTEETKEKQRLAHLGKKPTKDSIEKHRIKMIGKFKGEKSPSYGKNFYYFWEKKYGKEKADERMRVYLENRPRGKNHPNFGKLSPIRGEKHPNSKLNTEKVKEIKRLLKKGEIQKVIAQKFGVSDSTIGMIKIGRLWKNV